MIDAINCSWCIQSFIPPLSDLGVKVLLVAVRVGTIEESVVRSQLEPVALFGGPQTRHLFRLPGICPAEIKSCHFEVASCREVMLLKSKQHPSSQDDRS